MLGLKNSLELYRLRKKTLKKSSVLIIPTVATTIFIGVMYSITPHEVCSSFLLSAVFLYFICLFLSMALNGRENDIYEETLRMHCLVDHSYYWSRELLLFTLNLCYMFVLTSVPTVLYLIDNTRFTRPMVFADVVCGGGYIFMCGLGGMATGDLFHPRIIGKRKNAILGAFAISLLAVSKQGLIAFSPAFGILHFILPPITDGLKSVGDNDFFEPVEMLLICLHMVIYYLLIVMLKIQMLEKRKFRY
ncbi:MAG: hypothetical protein K6A90_04840 [Lachnospiraceae bacterium]|nr:hypothetical protein [Lachnospiraceae bacterium]